jgi:hypothetical protein
VTHVKASKNQRAECLAGLFANLRRGRHLGGLRESGAEMKNAA